MLTVADGCATIRLNRPQHMNRLHRDDLLVLRAHVDALAADVGVRVLVVTGSGRMFCSGYHLGDLGESAANADAARGDAGLFEETVDALEALPMPTVARLNGSVYGGATDLALACDFRVGIAGIELRMVAARLGLHYYPNGLRRYVSRLGLQAAKRLFLLADGAPADELHRIGFLDHCEPDEAALDARVQAIVDTLAGNAPLAVRGMKASLNAIGRGEFDLPAMRAREAACATSGDLREGLAAVAHKRVPRFTGR